MRGPEPLPDPASAPAPGSEDAAFDRLFLASFNRLRRYGYRYLRSWEEAEDVVHDVFVRLWARREELPSIADVDAYLYTAVRNRALARLKHLGYEQSYRAEQSSPHVEPPRAPLSPEQEFLHNEIAAALQRAVDALPPRQRDVILLQWRGHTCDEIGAALGISPKTVSVHVSRALEALREILPPLLG